MGSSPLLYGESETDYNEIAASVNANLRPENVLEQIWVRDYVDLVWEVLRLRRFKSKLLYTAVEDTVVRVISPLLRGNLDVILPLAYGWANRTPAVVAEVEALLKRAGLDSEAVFAQILADKIDVIERIDLMIYRAEQRRNAALHEIGRWRDGVTERLRDMQSAFEAGMITRPRSRQDEK